LIEQLVEQAERLEEDSGADYESKEESIDEGSIGSKAELGQ